MTSAAIAIDRLQCGHCSKWRSRGDIVGDQRRGFICTDCLNWHFHALDVLGGNVPHACQECGVTTEQMKQNSKNCDLRMYVVPKDGIYQVLCRACCDEYVRKRRDLYGKTEFGRKGLNL